MTSSQILPKDHETWSEIADLLLTTRAVSECSKPCMIPGSRTAARTHRQIALLWNVTNVGTEHTNGPSRVEHKHLGLILEWHDAVRCQLPLD